LARKFGVLADTDLFAKPLEQALNLYLDLSRNIDARFLFRRIDAICISFEVAVVAA